MIYISLKRKNFCSSKAKFSLIDNHCIHIATTTTIIDLIYLRGHLWLIKGPLSSQTPLILCKTMPQDHIDRINNISHPPQSYLISNVGIYFCFLVCNLQASSHAEKINQQLYTM